MRLAVMQPYFLPYIGYFHLLDAVDTLVVLDTVKFPKSGWVNRNKIMIQARESWLTVPVESGGEVISSKSYLTDERFFEKLKRSLARAYGNSGELMNFFELVNKWSSSGQNSVTDVNVFLLKEMLKGLHRRCPNIIKASSLNQDHGSGQERILRIASSLGASKYINLSGGENLYDELAFKAAGIELLFVQSIFPAYRQRGDVFLPRLSVLDFYLNMGSNSEAWFGPRSYQTRPKTLQN